MDNVTDISLSIALKRKKELQSFLSELDNIADRLYDKLEFNGVFETLMSLEDVRIRYYMELYEQNRILSLKEKQNVR